MPRMSHAIQNSARIGIILIAALIVLLLALGIAVMTPPVQKYAKATVEKIVSERLMGRLSIGSLRTNLFSRIDLDDVELVDAKGFGDSLYVRHLGIIFSLAPLFHKKVMVRRVILDSAKATGVRTRQGSVRWPFLPTPRKKKETAWTVAIDSAEINGLTGRYRDSLLSMNLALDKIGGRLHFFRLDSLSARLHSGSGWARTPWWRGGIRLFEVSGVVSPKFLVLGPTRIDGDSTRVAGQGVIAFNGSLPWDLKVEVSTFLSPVAVVGKLPWLGRTGRLGADAALAGPLKRPRLSLRATAYGVEVERIPFDTVGILADYDRSGSLGGTLHFVSNYGAADVTSDLRIPSLLTKPHFDSYAVSLTAQRLRMTALLHRFGLRGKLPEAVAGVTGGAKGKRFTVLPDSATATISIFDGQRPARRPVADVRVRLENKAWDLAASLGEGNRMLSQGTLGPRGALAGGFDFVLGNPSVISRYFLEKPVTGSVSGAGRIGGTFKGPVLASSLQGRAVAWQGFTIDTMHADLDYEKGRFFYSNAGLSASGQLGTILPQLGVARGIAGQFSLAAHGSGTLDDPQGTAQLAMKDLRSGSFSANELQADLEYRHDTLIWNNARIAKDTAVIFSAGLARIVPGRRFVAASLRAERKSHRSGEISVEGALVKDSLSGFVKTDDFDVGLVAPWAKAAIPVQGAVSLQADFGGTVQNPSATAKIDFRHRLNLTQTITYRTDASLHDSLLVAKVGVLGDQGAESLAVSAALPLSLRSPWTPAHLVRNGARLSLDGVDVPVGELLGSFVPALSAQGLLSVHASALKSGGVWGAGGNARLDLASFADSVHQIRGDSIRVTTSFSGTLARPVAAADLTGKGLLWDGRSFQNIGLTSRLTGTTIFLDTLQAGVQGGSLGLAGTIPLQPLDSLLGATGLVFRYSLVNVPLAAVAPPSAVVALRGGTVSGGGTFGVRNRRPFADGTLSLRQGRFFLTDCEQPIGPVDAELLFKGDSVAVQSIRGRIGRDGRLGGSGYFHLSLHENARLALTASDFRLQCTDLDVGVQRASIRFSDSANAYVLAGDIDLAETRYSTFISPANLFEQFQRVQPRAPKKPNTLLERITLRTTINLDRNLTIETNIGRFVLDGTVSVVGSAARPGLAGSIDFSEGYVYYLDRKFTIEQGSFHFLDPYEMNPQVDLTATSSVTAVLVNIQNPNGYDEVPYTITLSVKGDLRQPAITLTSDPYLRPEQILSLMTLGTIQGNLGSDLASRLESIAAQQLAGFGTRKLEQWLNIESLNLELMGPQGTVITAVKRLSSRLTVSYQTALGQLGRPKVAATYRLLPFLYLIGTGDYNSASGGYDLHLRFSR